MYGLINKVVRDLMLTKLGRLSASLIICIALGMTLFAGKGSPR